MANMGGHEGDHVNVNVPPCNVIMPGYLETMTMMHCVPPPSANNRRFTVNSLLDLENMNRGSGGVHVNVDVSTELPVRCHEPTKLDDEKSDGTFLEYLFLRCDCRKSR